MKAVRLRQGLEYVITAGDGVMDYLTSSGIIIFSCGLGGIADSESLDGRILRKLFATLVFDDRSSRTGLGQEK